MYVFMENFIQSLTEHKASSLLKCNTAQFLGIIVAFGEIMIVNCLRPYYFFSVFFISAFVFKKHYFPESFTLELYRKITFLPIDALSQN